MWPGGSRVVNITLVDCLVAEWRSFICTVSTYAGYLSHSHGTCCLLDT